MKKHITKLGSSELLEVSGGMELESEKFWARRVAPIDPESGKQEKKKLEDVSSEPEKDDEAEES